MTDPKLTPEERGRLAEIVPGFYLSVLFTAVEAILAAREAVTLPLNPSEAAVIAAFYSHDFDGGPVVVGTIPTEGQTRSLIRNKLRAAYRIDARYGGAPDGDPWLPAVTLFIKREISAGKLAELAGLKPKSWLNNANLAALCEVVGELERRTGEKP